MQRRQGVSSERDNAAIIDFLRQKAGGNSPIDQLTAQGANPMLPE